MINAEICIHVARNKQLTPNYTAVIEMVSEMSYSIQSLPEFYVAGQNFYTDNQRTAIQR